MRFYRPVLVASLGVLCVLAALHGCGGRGSGTCEPACTNGASCVDGQCASTCVPSACGYDGICVDGGCARAHPGVSCPPPVLVAGGTVGPATPPQGCQKPVRPTALSPAQVQELGVHPVGRTVSFNVPQNTASVSIVSQAVTAPESITYQGQLLDNSVVPDKLFAPDGVLWFDDNVFPPDLADAFAEYGGGSPVVNFFTIPNTQRAVNIARDGGVPPGTWQFRVNDYSYECLAISGCDGGTDAGNYDVKVLTKPGSPARPGTLDLGIYLVQNNGMDSGSALSDPHMERMLKSLTTLFAQQGICPGTVTFYDVPAWAQARYAIGIDADFTGPCDAISQMFTLSQDNRSLNLFFVSAISGGSSGGSVLGIDGTIPGPSTIGGTVHSGAAVSVDDLTAGTCGYIVSPLVCGADEVAYIAAHEAGHWLGLFHTTEATGTFWDPLADTPRCVCQSCVPPASIASCGNASNPTLVTSSTCGNAKPECGGSDNLMFWLLGSSTGGKLTPVQGEVLYRNLAVQ